MSELKSILRATHPDMKPHLREVEDLGGIVTVTNGGHIRARLGGYQIFIAMTPTNPRNDIQKLRRIIRQFRGEISGPAQFAKVDHEEVRNNKKKKGKRRK